MAWNKSNAQTAEEVARQEAEMFSAFKYPNMDLESEEAQRILNRLLNDTDAYIATYDYSHDNGNQQWETLSRILCDNDRFYYYESDGRTDNEFLRELTPNEVSEKLSKNFLKLTELGESFGFSNEPVAPVAVSIPEEIAARTENTQQTDNGNVVRAFGMDISITKECDFSDKDFERYNPQSKQSYLFHPDKDFLEQLFDRIPENQIGVIVEGFTCIQDVVNYKNAEADFIAILNEERQLEEARLELVACGVSMDFPLSVFEKESCMRAVERCEQKLARETAAKKPKTTNKEGTEK